MNRKIHRLSAAVGAAVLAASAAADDTHVPLRDAVAQVGARVTGAVGPRSWDDSGTVITTSGTSPDGAGSREIPFEGSAAGHFADGQDGARSRPPEVLVPSRRTGSPPPAPLELITFEEFLAQGIDDPATVPFPDEPVPPPPPPPATVRMPPTVNPSPAPTPDYGHVGPVHLDSATVAGVDPRYQSAREGSVYVSSCERCGRVHCRCTYAPFGDAVHSAFGRQVRLGSAELMTLYAYDFHPQDTTRPSELTPRGLSQLEKIVRRMQYTPAQIKIESTQNGELDTARRARVVEALGALGIADASGLVVTVRTRDGRPAIEMLEHSDGLLESIRARGRTIRGETSAAFSGGALFGQ